MITVNGRVRATVRLTENGVDGACVVASSWSSARPFPRTLASGVAFELETAAGDVYTVDPFEALLVLPVRRRVADHETRTEDAWIADGDEVEVWGELQPGRGRAHPTLRARRLATPSPESTHRVPPRSLTRGQSERFERPRAAPVAAPPEVAELSTTAPAEPPLKSEASPVPESEASPVPESEPSATAEPAEPGQAPRRPKKKRFDPSGTPTPIQ